MSNFADKIAENVRLAMFDPELVDRVSLGRSFWVAKTAVAGYTKFVEEHPAYESESGGVVDAVYNTVDAAVGACTADKGDVIFVVQGHTETLTGASAIDLDVAGISIIGLGEGKLRPQLLLDGAATVDIEVAADDVSIKNIIFLAGHADIATCFEIGAAKQFTVEDCDFLDNTSGENFLIIFRTNTTANAADGLTIRRCNFITPDTASLYFIHFQEDIDRWTMEDCYINMGVNTNDYPIVKCATGKDVTNIKVLRNHASRLNDANDLFIDNDTTANSGVAAYNTMLHADTGSEILFDCDGVGLFENRATAVVTASGYVLPAIDS